jgi:hypothetical protein
MFGQAGSQPLNSCTESDSPIIQGLRLGTSFSDIKQDTKLDLSKKTLTHSNVPQVVSYKITSPNENVEILYLDFYKNRLITMMVFYAPIIKWNSMQEFAKKISESLNVYGEWKITKSSNNSAFDMHCKHFYLNLDVAPVNRYIIYAGSSDMLAQKQQDAVEEQKRRDAINRKKKETFKP